MAAHQQYAVDTKDRKPEVLSSQYERLLEDLHLAVVAERCDEKTITLEELKRRLKKA